MKILILEEQPSGESSYDFLKEQPGVEVLPPAAVTGDLSQITADAPDIILLHLPDTTSENISLLETVQSHAPYLPILAVVDSLSEETAVELLKKGAQDCLCVDSLAEAETLLRLRFAVEHKKMETGLRATNQELQFMIQQLEGLIAESNQIAVNADIAAIELDRIFNTSADGMWVLSKDFKITKINDAFVKLFGTSREELIGKSCFDVFHGSLCSPEGCPVISLLHGKHRVEYDVKREKEDGERQYFILTATPLKVLDGQVTGFVGSYTDITDRKIAEAKLKQANQTLTELSVSDGLTQIPNRRKFDEQLAYEWNRLKREEQPLSLIICDIDFFKRYNDTYGHQAGDECLIQVAREIARNAKRPADLAARYGGEEFAVILPNTPPQGALQLAEIIREHIEKLQIPHKNSEAGDTVSLSLGVAGLIPISKHTPQELIEMADKALYQAKENGRNRAVLGP